MERGGDVLRGHRCACQDFGDDRGCRSTAHLGIGIQEEAVAEDGDRLRLHVVGQNVPATPDRGVRLGCAIQRESRPRTRPELDPVDAPSSSDDLDGVSADRVAHRIIFAELKRVTVDDRQRFRHLIRGLRSPRRRNNNRRPDMRHPQFDCQLSRAVEQRTPHIPQLSDLRESGALEQDADVVLFIYRDEKYNPDTDKKGVADIIVAKHRNGPTGQVQLLFLERTTKFLDLKVYRS